MADESDEALPFQVDDDSDVALTPAAVAPAPGESTPVEETPKSADIDEPAEEAPKTAEEAPMTAESWKRVRPKDNGFQLTLDGTPALPPTRAPTLAEQIDRAGETSQERKLFDQGGSSTAEAALGHLRSGWVVAIATSAGSIDSIDSAEFD
jgi:hypothetical protein